LAVHVAYNATAYVQPRNAVERLHRRDVFLRLLERWPELRLTLITPGGWDEREPLATEDIRLRPGPLAGVWFDQVAVPSAARRGGADVLWTPAQHAPIQSPIPLLVELDPVAATARSGLAERLRAAAGAAGERGAQVMTAWSDTAASAGGRIVPLPVTVAPAFQRAAEPNDAQVRTRLGLPEEYVLCLGAGPGNLDFLIAAWTWVDGSVGELYPLVLTLHSPADVSLAMELAAKAGTADSVRIISLPAAEDLPTLIRGARLLVDPPRSASLQPLRWGMSCGTAIAAAESPTSSSVVGEAAYLVAPGDARGLGAACLTMLVNDDVRQRLVGLGLERAAAYHRLAALNALRNAIERAAAAGKRNRPEGDQR
jgi:hypothetical protein